MVSTRRLFQVLPAFSMLLGSLSGAIGTQAQSPSEMRSATRSAQRCTGADPIRNMRVPAERFDRQFAGSENTAAVEWCDERGAEESPAIVNIVNKEDDPPILTHQIDSPADAPDLRSRLPVQPSIRAFGNEATAIAHASAAVLEILASNNSCSAWFAKSDPHIAETFSSLQFWIERDGPDHVVQERGENGTWIRHGPYIARTSENTGAGTNVAINASGAFFRGKAEIFRIEWQQGLELPTNSWQNLHIGPYEGATARAQIITLLHELGHVVGAIPSDGMSPSGLNRSEQNTEVVLQHCKTAVDSSGKRALIEFAQSMPK